MEQEIVVQRLNASSLFRPLLVGASLVTLPFWLIGLFAALAGGATINGEHLTGAIAVLAWLFMGPVFALSAGTMLWLYVSVCLWAYSKWGEIRLRFTPDNGWNPPSVVARRET